MCNENICVDTSLNCPGTRCEIFRNNRLNLLQVVGYELCQKRNLVPDRNSLLGTVLVPGWESFSPKVGIFFIPAVTNNKSAEKNISSVLMNNMPLLMNKVSLLMNKVSLLMKKVPLSQDLTCKSKKVPVERHFKRIGRLQEVTSDLT